MSIQGIRNLQVTSICLYFLAFVSAGISIATLSLGLAVTASRFFELSLVSLAAGASFMFIAGRIRCPVCDFVFVGRRSKRYFTRTCRNCGRRAGDTA
ncbi:hypothetical protein EV700_1090 [Fluviicoccus keumensis]|uniref:Uncharacterized protein n=1 Tax=Fluviicoccus keumensis TaxID=1435465 RepID=A0A4Q7ZA92_9GAMM|nr:hypothetical protein EV700_1090 [Fluviicoccus keumensis]